MKEAMSKNLAPRHKAAGSSLKNPSVWEAQPLASPTTVPLSLLVAAELSSTIGHLAQELRVVSKGPEGPHRAVYLSGPEL